MKRFSSKLLAITILSTSLIIACSEDDDEPTNPGGTTTPPVVLTQVPIQDMISNTPSIMVNPEGVAPLTALIEFSTNSMTRAEIKVLGNIPVSNDFKVSAMDHKLDILGLYPGTTNKVELKLTGNTTFAIDTLDVITDSLPSNLPSIEIVTANKEQMEEGMNLNCMSITNGTRFEAYPLAYDADGVIRWYLNLTGKYQAAGFVSPWEPIDNGRLLAEVGNQIIEFDMMGREAKAFPVPSGYTSHHDVIKLPNGHYAIAVNDLNSTMPWTDNGTTQNRQTVEDVLIEVDGSGSIVQEWDLKDLLDVDREDLVPSLQSWGAVDWFHMNAVYYSESDDTYLLSGRSQGVVKVDRQGKIVWIMAPHKGWGNAGVDGNGYRTDSLLLTAVNASGTAYDTSIQNGNANDPGFDWPWGQHAPMVLPNGNIALFDNGVNRTFDNPTAATPNYSRYVEYKIDETNMTIQQVNTYGENRGRETFSWIISDVDYLPNTGNVLFCPGVSDGFTTSRIVELDQSMQVVFEGKLTFANEMAPPPGSPLTFGQLDLTYRAERVKLYR